MIYFFNELPSTNDYAVMLAKKGVPHGTAVQAIKQSCGQGTKGRSFYSPIGGLYISIVLRKNCNDLRLSSHVAVALCKAIEDECNLFTKIKWVNDLLIDGKKVAGIIVKTNCNTTNPQNSYAVVGIGVNISTSFFPEELRSIAASLFSAPPEQELQNRLTKEIIRRVSADISGDLIEEYKKRSCVLGKEIAVHSEGSITICKVLDIDSYAGLVVRTQNGKEMVLRGGDISVKGML